MAIPTRQGHLGLLLTYLLVALLAVNVRCQPDEPAQHPVGPENTRQFPDLPVLGYVTPWNPRGKELVEQYRQKFDIVSPVWYTVHASGEDQGEGLYTVRGGPPSEEDEAWYRRLQQPPAAAGDDPSSSSRPLQVAPRFFLDGWAADDYQGLVPNQTRWRMLSDAIMEVVTGMSFDGVVLESWASYALGPPLTAVSDALHAEGKILILVMPPVRGPGGGGDADSDAASHNSMILGPVAGLSHHVDYFSIMTYDMTGPGGREVRGAGGLPGDSPVRRAIAQGQVRGPGPNTGAGWVRDNLVAFVESSQPGPADRLQYPSRFRGGSPWASRRFLMGVPLYGYRYPVLFIDEGTGNVAQRPAAGAAGEGEGEGAAFFPILTGAGEPVTTVEIAEIIRGAGSQEVSMTEEGEYFFDYEKAPGEGYWRVFLPTGEGVSRVLGTIQDVVDDELMYTFGGAGVALWEVGQSSAALLESL